MLCAGLPLIEANSNFPEVALESNNRLIWPCDWANSEELSMFDRAL